MTQPCLAYAQTVLPIHRHVNRPRDDQTPLPLTSGRSKASDHDIERLNSTQTGAAQPTSTKER